jgi:hypothetical protein
VGEGRKKAVYHNSRISGFKITPYVSYKVYCATQDEIALTRSPLNPWVPLFLFLISFLSFPAFVPAVVDAALLLIHVSGTRSKWIFGKNGKLRVLLKMTS